MTSAIVGGLGLFLLGMWLMTDGLRLAAGDALRALLARWTSSPLRGLVTGFALTGLVQSSGVVTVATVGFANAGLLTLGQAVWVVYGANVGSTMTGWLVAILGFEIDIALYALPLIGIGMALRLAGSRPRLAALGQAIAGAGVLFLGIDTLKDGFDAWGAGVALPAPTGSTLRDTLVYAAVGAGVTALMQSSSAAMVLAFSALAAGLVTPLAAAAVCVGTNVGTTSTATLAAWGATPTAKRVAASHVIFNLASAAAALAVLPVLLAASDALAGPLGLAASPPARLALFNTALNLLGVALIRPVTPWLVRRLERRFAGRDDAARLVYLDRTVLPVPALALAAAARETARLRDLARDGVRAWLAVPDDPAPLAAATGPAHARAEAIARALAELSAGRLGAGDVARVQALTRTLHHCLAALEDAAAAAATRSPDAGPMPERDAFEAGLRARLDDPAELAEADETRLTAEREAAKARLVAAVAERGLGIDALDHALRGMNAEIRMLRHLRKAGGYLAALAGAAPALAPPPEADAA